MQKSEFCSLRAENNIVKHGKNVDKLKALMHHTYSERRCVVGVVYFNDLAVFLDCALFGLIKSEKHRHKSRFSRAVFTEKRMYLAAAKLKRDIVICDDSGKLLCDVEHFDYIVIFFWQFVHIRFLFSGKCKTLYPASDISEINPIRNKYFEISKRRDRCTQMQKSHL